VEHDDNEIGKGETNAKNLIKVGGGGGGRKRWGLHVEIKKKAETSTKCGKEKKIGWISGGKKKL